MSQNVIEVKVKPNSHEFSVEKKDSYYITYITSKPENNQANLELVKELGKLFGKEVKIIKGLKSKKKMILLKDKI